MQVKQIFPPASDRQTWIDALKKTQNRKLKKVVMEKAKNIMTEPIPDFTASLFMNYIRNGNRNKYETPYFQRRINLGILALAETFEYKGRYIDRIIDYIWEITSEHTWCVPAHCWLKDDPFPEFPVGVVDLFNSETGFVLALVMNLLENEIKAVSPNFVKMVRDEIDKRIAEPLEKGPAPFWFEGVNNWTPWCCNNSLGAIVWALRDEPERQAKLVDTLHTAIKNFIRLYPEDGFCFEGPAYWVVSPGRMLYFLEQLGVWHDEPKIKKMAEYIADTRMSAERSMNFGDSRSISAVTPWIIYRFGEKVGSEPLKSMAMESLIDYDNTVVVKNIFDALSYIFWLPQQNKKAKFSGREFAFYEKTQFFIMRKNGAVLAAKRGHAWSHHHMDIGHFMLFFNGEPIIIDRGSSEYTKDTFNNNRFKNDILNAKAHNVLHFNNIDQFEEAPPAPGAMTCSKTEDFISCRMDTTTSYVPEAKVKSCVRELVYDCNAKVLNLIDSWELETDSNDIYANFFTPAKVVQRDGKLFIGKVAVTFNGCDFIVEKVKITDSSQLANWGKFLNRIQIRKKSAKKGNWHLSFELK